ncbi:D-amino acid dehydrogenase [Sabulicella glaciei]|nr:D-amino acid dehydrogenase [Roseococcus sp. MDT2-1-1]
MGACLAPYSGQRKRPPTLDLRPAAPHHGVMHVLVLGAGVVGLSTAHLLAAEGWRVTVLDAEPSPGRGASFANGGQLSYSYVAPFAGPGVLRKVPSWLMDPDGPLRLRPEADPHQWKWLLRFIRACNADTAEQTTRRLLLLSYLSRDLMRETVALPDLDFDFTRAGKLVVQPDEGGMAGARRQMELQARLGSEQRALSREECLEAEPALRHIAHRIAGGILTESEEAGDARRFSEALAERLTRGNAAVTLRLGARIRQIIRADGRIRAVATEEGPIEADHFVVALGNGARPLLRPLGLDLPIYPLKGYSLTLDVVDESEAPRLSVTDSAAKVVYARLGKRLRVAGMADLVGHDRRIEESRLTTLLRQARATFPGASDWGEIRPWAGLRPSTPTGLPILGPTLAAPNLWLNLGHGSLGFTLAMGSAAVVAAMMVGRPAPIPTDGFTLP